MRDINNAFGRTPESFERFVESTLRQKQREEQSQMKHKGLNGVLVFVLVIALLAGTAFALTSGFGLTDFRNRHGMPMLPEASEQIADLSRVESAESLLVRYHMQEALVDGDRLLLTFAAEPVAPDKHLLMGVMELPTDFPEGSDRSYEQIAKEEGKTLVEVSAPGISINGQTGGGGSADFVYQEGKLIYYVEGTGLPLDGDTLPITCAFADREIYSVKEVHREDGSISYPVDAGELNRSEIVFKIKPNRAAPDLLRFEGPFACERMNVNWVELSRTAAATYLRVEYTVNENLTEEDREALEFMHLHIMRSAEDEDFPQGGSGSTAIVQEGSVTGQPDGTTYLQETVWPAMDAFPEAIYLRPYYKLLGEWGEAIVLNAAEGVQ